MYVFLMIEKDLLQLKQSKNYIKNTGTTSSTIYFHNSWFLHVCTTISTSFNGLVHLS